MAMGRIHSWESMGLVDGPGIRTVIFLQGCRLRCRYCHNPDTWELCGGGTLESPEETVNRLKLGKRKRSNINVRNADIKCLLPPGRFFKIHTRR